MAYNQFHVFIGVAFNCTATGHGVNLLTIEIQRSRFIALTVIWMFPFATGRGPWQQEKETMFIITEQESDLLEFLPSSDG